MGGIITADNTVAEVTGQGNIKFQAGGGHYTLKGVQHCPDVNRPLLSVGQMAKQGHVFVFGDSAENSYVARKGELDKPLFHMELEETQHEGVLYKLPLITDPGPPLKSTVPLISGWASGARGTSPYMGSGTWELWHARMGHKSGRYLKELSKNVVEDMVVTNKKEKCDLVGCSVCTQGKLQRSAFRKKIQEKGKPLEPLNLIHMDLMGPMDLPGQQKQQNGQKAKYILTLTDDATNFVWAFCLSNKDDAGEKIRDWTVQQERQFKNYTIKAVRSDRGGEFVNNTMRAWLTEKGILHDLSCSYTPQQNGKAERMNRTLAEMVRCMLLGSGLPKKYWDYAVQYATWIQNRCVTAKRRHVTAYQLLMGERPSLGQAKVFGCMAQVYVPEKMRQREAGNKLDARARWAIFLGIAPDAKAWIFQYIDKSTEGHSRDAFFHEQLTYQKWRTLETRGPNEPYPEMGQDAIYGDPFSTIMELPKEFPVQWSLPPVPEDSERQHAIPKEPLFPSPMPVILSLVKDDDKSSTAEISEASVDPPEGSKPDPTTPTFGSGRYPLRHRTKVVPYSPSASVTTPIAQRQPETEFTVSANSVEPYDAEIWFEDEESDIQSLASVNSAMQELSITSEECDCRGSEFISCPQCQSAQPVDWDQRYTFLPSRDSLPLPPVEHPKNYREPQSWKQLLKDPYARDWILAAKKEYGQIEDKRVWEWAFPPPGTPVMGTKWVFVRKTKVDGSLDKFKGRICVQGFTSIAGIHHFETFAPTASAPAARLMFAIGCAKGWKIEQLDVSGAFLYADLEEKIYCKPPPGFEDPEGRVWLLRKSLYGLKQAPREWIATLGARLKEAGFQQSAVEPTLWILQQEEEVLHLLVFVDDILIGSLSDRLLDYTKKTLRTHFDMTELGAAEKYLGWHITRDISAGKLWLSLEPRIKKAVSAFRQDEYAPTRTPLPTNWQAWLPHETDKDNPQRRPPLDSKDQYSELLSPTDHSLYRQGVGFINYVACALRPDVSYAAGQLSQMLHVPRERHLKAMYHCLRYLNGTADLAIVYDKTKPHQLLAYSDSDYAGCVGTRKSTSGGLFTFIGGAVHWFSKKQGNITLSATEAEFGAMQEVTRDIQWLRQLLEELDSAEITPTPLFVDNMGAVLQSRNPLVNRYSRHVAVNMHYVRQHQSEYKTIIVIHQPSDQQAADYLTKSLSAPQLQKNIRLAGQEDRPQISTDSDEMEVSVNG
jgi:transposase InsO family protein